MFSCGKLIYLALRFLLILSAGANAVLTFPPPPLLTTTTEEEEEEEAGWWKWGATPTWSE